MILRTFMIVLLVLIGFPSSARGQPCREYGSERADSIYFQRIESGQSLRFVEHSQRELFDIIVQPHAVCDHNNETPITNDLIQLARDNLNNAYSACRLRFSFLPLDHITIPDLYDIDTGQELSDLFLTNNDCHAVNIYFVGSIGGGSIGGRSTKPEDCAGQDRCNAELPPCPDGVVIQNTLISTTTVIHEVGHFFGLRHTHHENGETRERVTREGMGVNCTYAADGLCDTEADPQLGWIERDIFGIDVLRYAVDDCEYNHSGGDPDHFALCNLGGIPYICAKDENDEEYHPDVTNFMSYAPWECLSTFSPYQLSVVVSSLVDLRPELHHIELGQGSENPTAYVTCANRNNLDNLMPVSTVRIEGAWPSEVEVQELLLVSEQIGQVERAAIMLADDQPIAYLVRGAIYAKYTEIGRGNSVLGYPVSDEDDAYPSIYGTTGRYTRFENGSINYISSSPTHSGVGQCYAIYGPIYEAYEIAGYSSANWSGFPTSSILRTEHADYMYVEEGGYFKSIDGAEATFISSKSPDHFRSSLVGEFYNTIRLIWWDHSNVETSFSVLREDPTSGRSVVDTIAILPPESEIYDDVTAQLGITYRYYVVAAADSIYSPPSNSAYARLQNNDWETYVNAVEYYFDNDPGRGLGTLVTFAPTIEPSLSIEANISSLSIGSHTAFLRYLDSRGVWSVPEARDFMVTASHQYGPLSIDAAEYFLDEDPGPGTGVHVPLQASGEVGMTHQVNVSALNQGEHTVFLRYSTNSGLWSVPEGRSFYVTSPTDSNEALISSAEAFWDDDPGQGQGTSFDLQDAQEVTMTSTLPADAPTGFHDLYLRYQTAGGTWSVPEGRTVHVSAELADTLVISGGEVFIDTAAAEGSGVQMAASDGSFDAPEESLYVDLPLGNVDPGQHRVLTRVRDNRGLWSSLAVDSFEVVEVPHIELVALSDSLGEELTLVWTAYPGAIEYHVNYDSTSDGDFAGFMVVPASDTTLAISTIGVPELEFFKVIAIYTTQSPLQRAQSEGGVAVGEGVGKKRLLRKNQGDKQ